MLWKSKFKWMEVGTTIEVHAQISTRLVCGAQVCTFTWTNEHCEAKQYKWIFAFHTKRKVASSANTYH